MVSLLGKIDKMTISLMDFVAAMWLEKIDPRLAERVQIDFRVPISEGQRLSEMVPLIAKCIPSMLKKIEMGW